MTDPDRLAEIKARRAVADLPWVVKTDTTDGPEIRDAYNEVARIDVPSAVWECDDELDGCPDGRRESIRRARFIAQAPQDIDWLVGEVERLQRYEAIVQQVAAGADFETGDLHEDGCPAASDPETDIDWLVGEVERLRGLLARLEWAGGTYCDEDACPECSQCPHDGHAPDCWLAAELRP